MNLEYCKINEKHRSPYLDFDESLNSKAFKGTLFETEHGLPKVFKSILILPFNTPPSILCLLNTNYIGFHNIY